MTLLEILLQELPKRGGWPNKYNVAHTDGGLFKIVFAGPNLLNFAAPWSEAVDISNGDTLITREQYEEALAAVEPEWNGEGLPPVGVNCEIIFEDDTPPKWYSFVATFIGSNHIVALVGMEELTYKKGEILRPGVKFRPIRSEADRKRDELAKSLHVAAGAAPVEHCGIGPLYLELADKIIAGEVPHLKIV